MSDDPIDYQAVESFLLARRKPFIKPGTMLDRGFFAWCQEVEFGLVEIMSLFQKTTTTSPTQDELPYLCEIQCPSCRKWRTKHYGKKSVSKLVSAAKFGSTWKLDCSDCKDAAAEERKRSYDPDQMEKLMRELASQEQDKARERTPAFIERYLDPRSSWNPGTPPERRFEEMTSQAIDCEVLAVAIRTMTKEDFRRTLYWDTVHAEVMRRARSKCSLCAALGKLTIHHRTPPRLGYEHTEEGLCETLCLCGRCKNNHLLSAGLINN